MKSLVVFFLTFNLYASEFWNGKIQSFGNLEEVLKYQGSGDSINLRLLKNTPSLYLLGLTEFLQNEVLIINGKPFISSVKNKRVNIDKSFNYQSSFMVYATVPKWKSYQIPKNLFTKKQLEEYLEELAQEEGIDTYEPFPFLIEGKVKASRYRVFSHNPNDLITTSIGTCASCNEGDNKLDTKKRYLSSTLYKVIQDENVTILGFYSNQRGVITTKDSYTNMNFITKNKRLSGHLLNMMLGQDMVLKLPVVE